MTVLSGPDHGPKSADDLWDELGFWGGASHQFGSCMLHIGTEKTGTTSLQNFLGVNRAALFDAGIVVPRSLSPYEVAANHERLTTFALADEKVNDDLRVAAQVRLSQQVASHRGAITRALREEIGMLPNPERNGERMLLLSNEHCQSRLVEHAEIARLKTFLDEFVRRVKVTVYLRPQHDLAISLYDQALKSGYSDIAVLPDFTGRTRRWVNRGYFDYAEMLDRWATVFGHDNIDVRIYGKTDLVDGNVISDFVSRLGLNTQKLVFDKNSNVSMSAERQMAMNAVNRLAKQRDQPLPLDLRSSLIEQLQTTSQGIGVRPSRAEAEAFYHSFALSNEKVRATFLPERTFLFNPDFSIYEEPAATMSEADALAATVLAQQQTINALKMRLMRRP